MPATAAWAPGKIILFGEHAVVYHRPAIAVPVTDVQARAVILPNPLGQPGSVQIDAPDIGLNALLSELPPDNPLATSILAVQEQLGLSSLPAFKIRITSTIPIAAGLGSGAAISAAIARAVSNFLGHPLSDSQVSDIAYRVDQYYHGTPSGIDNTVIAHNRPVYFVRGQPFQTLRVAQPFTLVIGNSGLPSPTGTVVGDLRARYEADPAAYEPIFNHIGAIAEQARERHRARRPLRPRPPAHRQPRLPAPVRRLLPRIEPPGHGCPGRRGPGRQAERRRARRQHDRPGGTGTGRGRFRGPPRSRSRPHNHHCGPGHPLRHA